MKHLTFLAALLMILSLSAPAVAATKAEMDAYCGWLKEQPVIQNVVVKNGTLTIITAGKSHQFKLENLGEGFGQPIPYNKREERVNNAFAEVIAAMVRGETFYHYVNTEPGSVYPRAENYAPWESEGFIICSNKGSHSLGFKKTQP